MNKGIYKAIKYELKQYGRNMKVADKDTRSGYLHLATRQREQAREHLEAARRLLELL